MRIRFPVGLDTLLGTLLLGGSGGRFVEGMLLGGGGGRYLGEWA